MHDIQPLEQPLGHWQAMATKSTPLPLALGIHLSSPRFLMVSDARLWSFLSFLLFLVSDFKCFSLSWHRLKGSRDRWKSGCRSLRERHPLRPGCAGIRGGKIPWRTPLARQPLLTFFYSHCGRHFSGHPSTRLHCGQSHTRNSTRWWHRAHLRVWSKFSTSASKSKLEMCHVESIRVLPQGHGSSIDTFFSLSFFSLFVMVLLVRYSADTREARRGSQAWFSRAQSIHLWLAVVSTCAVSRWLMWCCVMHGMGIHGIILVIRTLWVVFSFF